MPYMEVARDVKLYYEDWGEGPVIIFVHGWTMSHKFWSYQTLKLPSGMRTIAYDLRGHGMSDKPFSSYSYQEYAYDLLHLILGLNLRNVTLVGWSMGAGICMEYLRLFGTERIAGFVSVGGSIPKYVKSPDWPYGLPLNTLQAWFDDLHRRRPEWQEELFNRIFVNPTVGSATKRWIWTIGMQASFPAAVGSLITLRNTDFRAFIPYIRIPFALFQGAKDDITLPEATQWIHAHNPRSKLIMFDESGHTPCIEEIDKFNAELTKFVFSLTT